MRLFEKIMDALTIVRQVNNLWKELEEVKAENFRLRNYIGDLEGMIRQDRAELKTLDNLHYNTRHSHFGKINEVENKLLELVEKVEEVENAVSDHAESLNEIEENPVSDAVENYVSENYVEGWSYERYKEKNGERLDGIDAKIKKLTERVDSLDRLTDEDDRITEIVNALTRMRKGVDEALERF